MSTLSILRNALKLNAENIKDLAHSLAATKHAAHKWVQADPAFADDARASVAKRKAVLARAVEMQKRTKVEIAAIFQRERIARKYEAVFGKKPDQNIYTLAEQEAMLDTLLAEKSAEAALAVAQ